MLILGLSSENSGCVHGKIRKTAKHGTLYGTIYSKQCYCNDIIIGALLFFYALLDFGQLSLFENTNYSMLFQVCSNTFRLSSLIT